MKKKKIFQCLETVYFTIIREYEVVDTTTLKRVKVTKKKKNFSMFRNCFFYYDEVNNLNLNV